MVGRLRSGRPDRPPGAAAAPAPHRRARPRCCGCSSTAARRKPDRGRAASQPGDRAEPRAPRPARARRALAARGRRDCAPRASGSAVGNARADLTRMGQTEHVRRGFPVARGTGRRLSDSVVFELPDLVEADAFSAGIGVSVLDSVMRQGDRWCVAVQLSPEAPDLALSCGGREAWLAASGLGGIWFHLDGRFYLLQADAGQAAAEPAQPSPPRARAGRPASRGGGSRVRVRPRPAPPPGAARRCSSSSSRACTRREAGTASRSPRRGSGSSTRPTSTSSSQCLPVTEYARAGGSSARFASSAV